MPVNNSEKRDSNGRRINENERKMMSRKRSYHYMRYFPEIFLEGQSKTTRTPRIMSIPAGS
jgi:hypothetical protein